MPPDITHQLNKMSIHNRSTSSSSTSHSLSLPKPSKLLRPRSKSPAALDTRRSTAADSSHLTSSPTQMSPTSPHHRPGYDKRGSQSSTASYSHSRSHSNSYPSSHSHPVRRSSDDYRRLSGTVNHCGRHSNDWLFGGFSLRDTVREGVDKLRQHNEREG